MSQYLSHLAALTLKQVEPVQPRLASRFEKPVDRGASGHNGLDVTQENRVSMPHEPVQPSMVTATDSPDHMTLMQPRQASRFETPVDRGSFGHNSLNVAQEAMVFKPHEPLQPSTVKTTDKPVAQTDIKASVEGQAKKASNEQDQPKVVQPTEIRIKQSEIPGEQQKKSSDKNFSLADKVHVIPTVQVVNEPVAHAFQAVRQDTRPTEHVHTLVERVQEHFTETTHNELVIREVAVSAEKQAIIKPQTSTLPTPVKPGSIKPWIEQSIVGLNSPSQSSTQKLNADQSVIDTTLAPTIQVTIGRIEIRATQVAQKLAEKPRAVSNTLSLDDYLKQRNGGKS